MNSCSPLVRKRPVGPSGENENESRANVSRFFFIHYADSLQLFGALLLSKCNYLRVFALQFVIFSLLNCVFRYFRSKMLK